MLVNLGLLLRQKFVMNNAEFLLAHLFFQMEGTKLVQSPLSYEEDHILWEAPCYIALRTFFSGWNKIPLLFKGSFQAECLCLDTVGCLSVRQRGRVLEGGKSSFG